MVFVHGSLSRVHSVWRVHTKVQLVAYHVGTDNTSVDGSCYMVDTSDLGNSNTMVRVFCFHYRVSLACVHM